MFYNNPMPAQRRPNSLRHPGADYSDPGLYFVTLCTQGREPLFGEVNNGEMKCSTFGNIVWETWKHLPIRYPGISIDSAVVMPDHFHGIIVIHDYPSSVGAIHELPLHATPRTDRAPSPHNENELPVRHTGNELSLRARRRLMTIPLIIGYLKMNSAKQINRVRKTPGEHVWQRNYFDKILCVDKDYDLLVEYILSNPQNWETDKE